MTTPPTDHWLDRLSLSLTRRQALRAALAGASLTLPLGLVRNARAADPNDCRTGCLYTSLRKFEQARNGCDIRFFKAQATYLLNPALAVGQYLAAFACMETAVLVHKARAYDCYQPNCSGFDPKGKDGPCEHIPAGSNCCVCPNVPTGYVPCYFSCDDPKNRCCP